MAVVCCISTRTDLAVVDIGPAGFVVQEIVAGLDLAGLQARTEAELTAAPELGVLSAPDLG